MQNKKNTWFDRIKDVLGESPKAKEDLLELLKNCAVDGVIDIESLKMIEKKIEICLGPEKNRNLFEFQF